MTVRKVEHKLDARVVDCVRHVASNDLSSAWRELDVGVITWDGVDHPVEQLSLLDSDDLEIDFFCSDHQLVRESTQWRPGAVVAQADSGRILRIDGGISRELDHVRAGRKVRIDAGAWRLSQATGHTRAHASLWVSQLDFGIRNEPHLLEMGADNLRLRAGELRIRGWCFNTSEGTAALFRSYSGHWYLGFPAHGADAPSIDTIIQVAALLTFAIGQPFRIGCFQRFANALSTDVVRFPIADNRSRNPHRRAPGLPAIHGGYWLAQFIELGLAFMSREPSAPFLTAIHHSVEGFDGILDTEFLHVWIAAEALASWALRNKRLKDGGALRIADHNAWHSWVRANEAEIKAHAMPGMERKLIDRVLGSETTTPTAVQRLFIGEGISWTQDLDDLERSRNGVAHEGGMPGYLTRDWPADVNKVGLALNVLATIVAKLIGYDGPISDRSTMSLSISGDDTPAWWRAAREQEIVTYHE